MNELSVTEQETILGLLRLGWSLRRIQRETGHRRETIARYGIAAGVLTPKPAKVATDPVTPIDAAEPAARAPELPAPMQRSRSNCEVHRPFIEAEVAKGKNGVAIYQDLVEHHGYAGAYNAVKRFIAKLRPHEPQVKCRFETEPGQENASRLWRGRQNAAPDHREISSAAAFRNDAWILPACVSQDGVGIIGADSTKILNDERKKIGIL